MSKCAQVIQYQNSQHTRVMNLKYKSKYKRIKRVIKNLVYENAALCDEVAQIQSELTRSRGERYYLIKRLMPHEGFENLERMGEEQWENSAELQTKVNETPLHKKRGPKRRIQTGSFTATKSDKSRLKARDRVTLDDNGKPIFPINLYNILVHSPGEIIPENANFHTAHWIYPVGYVATRIYAHPNDPQRKSVFTCKILNNAGVPQFQIIPDNDLDSVFFGETANVCHQNLLEALQQSLSNVVKLPLRIQGEKFFGLANPTVKTLLQMDAGFTQCANFKSFLTPEESGFGIPDDKDPTMSFEALQLLIAMSAYHTLPEVKEEPPDQLFEIY